MSKNLLAVQEYGQSIWMDYIHRKDLQSGALQAEIDAGVLGVTSNPAIFQKSIGNSDIYDSEIASLPSADIEKIYETLAIKDIQDAAKLFLPTYERTEKIDGYVSLEVSPKLAFDTEGTVADAKRLYAAVGSPNIFIKIPSTQEGIPAIEEVIFNGINVNVTLIFSVENYEQVAEAYIRGLERRMEQGLSVTGIASVASFFLSRIDVMVDDLLSDEHQDLRGLAALANAKIAYQSFERIFYGERFAALREAGAQVQRPLWASTGTKNPSYPDTLYVDTLIGKHTVNTIPPKTLDAFKDHGVVAETIYAPVAGHSPQEVMDKLAAAGIDIDEVTTTLQDKGVQAFVDSFDTLLSQIAEKAEKVSG